MILLRPRALFFWVGFALTWVSFPSPAQAQTIDCMPVDSGSIVYRQTRTLDSIIAVQRRRDRYNRSIPGFRLQLAATSSRREAEALRGEISEEFPELSYTIDFESPYYKLKVGNFRSRTEALLPKLMLGESGYNGFIVPDKIDFPALPGDRKQ